MPHNDSIEIQAPPIHELHTKKSSFLKRSCLTGSGCLLIFAIIGFVGIVLASRSRTKTLHELPKQFPDRVPLYDTTAIETIRIAHHTRQSDIIDNLTIKTDDTTDTPTHRWFTFITRLWPRIREEISRVSTVIPYDELTIEWTELTAQPKFIAEYYETHLQKNNFDTTITHTDSGSYDMNFSHTDTRIFGTIHIRDNSPQTPGTEEVTMSVQFPSE